MMAVSDDCKLADCSGLSFQRMATNATTCPTIDARVMKNSEVCDPGVTGSGSTDGMLIGSWAISCSLALVFSIGTQSVCQGWRKRSRGGAFSGTTPSRLFPHDATRTTSGSMLPWKS